MKPNFHVFFVYLYILIMILNPVFLIINILFYFKHNDTNGENYLSCPKTGFNHIWKDYWRSFNYHISYSFDIKG